MKKRPRSEQPPAAFDHTPFRALKGLKTAASGRPAPPPPALTPVRQDEDAASLFSRAVQGVKRFRDEEPEAIAAPAAAGPTPTVPAPDETTGDESLFIEAMRSFGAALSAAPAPRDEDAGLERSPVSPTSRMRQLKRGTLVIGRELDLHGYHRDEALQRLGFFIGEAASAGHAAVLVITGKGINSSEGPVLQAAVSEWLRGAGSTRVAEFHPAPRDRGGSGAFVVFLRQAGGRKRH